MKQHAHFPDCKHNHRHSNECAHGTPTAVPRAGTCGVCNAVLEKPWYCETHKRWECASHNVQSHGDGLWVAITKQTLHKMKQEAAQRAVQA